jgi:hypothetical protein
VRHDRRNVEVFGEVKTLNLANFFVSVTCLVNRDQTGVHAETSKNFDDDHYIQQINESMNQLIYWTFSLLAIFTRKSIKN